MKSNWTRIVDAATIPPQDANNPGWSPKIWLYLSDGQVVMGQCLHRVPNANYKGLVHDWFAWHREHGSSSLSCYFWKKARVLAWAPVEAPEAPDWVGENKL